MIERSRETFDDKLLFQVEASRGMQYPQDDLSIEAYHNYIKMLRLCGFNFRDPYTEHLKIERKTKNKIEIGVKWSKPQFKPKLVLETDCSLENAKKSSIYKHLTGHKSSRKHSKVSTPGDPHKDAILGRSCRAIGFPQTRTSQIMIIDLDNHNYSICDPEKREEHEKKLIDIINTLIEELQTEPIYIERSLSGSYHLYFHISDSFFNQNGFIYYFRNKYKIAVPIENNASKKNVRIPGHWSYTPGQWCAENGFIADSSRYEFIDRFLNNYSNLSHMSNCQQYALYIMDFASQEEYDEFIEIASKDCISEPKPIIATEPIKKKNKLPRYSPYSYNITKPEYLSIEEIAQQYPISRGTRDYNLYMLRCLTANYPIDCYAELVNIADDGTSQDWNKLTTSQKQQELERIDRNVQKRKIMKSRQFTDNSGDFNSNIHLARESRDIKAEVVSGLMNIAGLNSKYSKVQESHREGIKIILSEMEGYILYQHRYKRKLNCNFADRTDLLQGFQFSSAWCNGLKKHHNIKFDVYRVVRNIINHMSQVSSLWAPAITRDGRHYSHYGITYCTQYGSNIYTSPQYRAHLMIDAIYSHICRLYKSKRRNILSNPKTIQGGTYMMCNFIAHSPGINAYNRYYTLPPPDPHG